MIRDYFQILNRLLRNLYINMDFKNHLEFEKKYLQLSLQRAKIFNWVIFVLSFYHFYLDFQLCRQDPAPDSIYRRNLLGIHMIVFLLSIVYLVIYKLLENKNRLSSPFAKVLILFEISATVFIAAILSLNSQRFIGNLNAYIMLILVVVLIIPLYPKWMISIYSVNHVLFLIGLYYFCTDESRMIKQFNSTNTVIVAIVLFLVLYRYNVTNFLNEEMLKEDKQTFIKLFEINPFPLLISRFEDGKVQYANRKAMLFYDIPAGTSDDLNHKYLYKNIQDFDVICNTLKAEGKVTDYLAEQKTLSGQLKYAFVNYELIDYFGGKSILSGVADVGEIKRMEQELTVYASTDQLTGVLNRRAGMDLIKRRFEVSQSTKEGFNLCFLDVDNLKGVNDTFGHLEGDVLIIEVCRIIREELQPGDIIFRYGGDEFMILFENSCEQDVRQICDQIAQRFNALNANQHKPYCVDASIGIFSYKPEMNLSLEKIIEIVDKDMYHNKAKKIGAKNTLN